MNFTDLSENLCQKINSSLAAPVKQQAAILFFNLGRLCIFIPKLYFTMNLKPPRISVPFIA